MILGIDLGTTYSVCAYLDENGEPQVVTNMEGSRTTPSVVYFENTQSVVVGQVAKDNSICCPERVVSAIKNHMGNKNYSFTTPDGQTYSPEVISSLILKKLVADAGDYLGVTEPIRDVVITIPAYFTDAERIATENAARIAGLNLLRTINEPTAAALYYAVKSKLNHANILIYDLGGGTFDVTIVRVDDDDVVVKSTNGLSKVGGRFFDEEIVDYIRDYVEDKYDVDLEDEEYLDVYQELFTRAEKTKIQLSRQERASIPVRTGEFKDNIPFTREEFEKIVASLYKRTEYCVKRALSDAGLQASDLDKIILVGGSSRIPYIQERLQALLGLAPSHEVNPDEVVAMGAAIFSKQLAGAPSNKKIYDVCSHGIGVIAMDERTSQRYNQMMIKPNSPLPTKAVLPFKTASECQEVIDLSITEGKDRDISYVRIISQTKVILPADLPKGTPGELELQLDPDQLVHVWLRIPSASYDQEFRFERIANLSEDEVEKLTDIIATVDVY